MKKTTSENITEVFYGKVDVSGSDRCWDWKGAVSSSGYGSMTINRKPFKAHRVSWELAFGKIKEVKGVDSRGTCVLHKCDNRLCVNPSHLFLGSHLDNMRDMIAKGRKIVPDNRGEKCGQSKLDNKKVLLIRKMYKTGDYTQKKLAKIFSVDQSNISYLVKNKTWKIV